MFQGYRVTGTNDIFTEIELFGKEEVLDPIPPKTGEKKSEPEDKPARKK